MSTIRLDERMYSALAELRAWRNGPELDVVPECDEDWTASHAIVLVTLIEPDDSVRRYFDCDAAWHDIREKVAEAFGPTASWKEGKPIRLHFHGKVGGWDAEIEAYRTSQKRTKKSAKKRGAK